MTKFRFQSIAIFPLGYVLLTGLAGCQSPAATTFWRGPLLQGFDEGNTRTLQKPSNDAGKLSSTKPPNDSETKPPETGTGPQLTGNSQAKLTLTVTAPGRVQKGSRVTFESVITNTGAAPATNVVIESKYHSGFRFPEHDMASAHQTLGTIPPGDSRRVAISLKAMKTGNQCVEFSVKVGGREAVWKSVCVDVESPRIQLQLAAPPLRVSGDRVEITALLANLSTDDLQGVTVTLRFDGELLSPYEASKGVKQEDGRLTWNVNKLNAGNGLPLQAEFLCRKPATKACVLVTVTATDAAEESQQLCFEIAAPHSTFTMTMSDTADLLAVGDETEIQIRLKNRTLRRVTGEPLTVVIPPNFRVVSTSAERAGKPLAVKFEVKAGRVQFESVPIMPSGDELLYRVKLKAIRAGQAVVRAKAGPDKRPLFQLSEPISVN